MTGRTIKSILFLNKQGFLTITTSSKSFCLSSDKIQHKLTKRQWLLKNGFRDHLPNFAKLPLPEEGNTTILFHKCVTLSTFNKSVKLFGLLKHKTNNFQYFQYVNTFNTFNIFNTNNFQFASLSVLASNYPFLRLTFPASVGKRFDILCFLNAVSKIQFNFEISRTDNKRLDWFFCKIYLEILRRRHFWNWVQLISRELMQPW